MQSSKVLFLLGLLGAAAASPVALDTSSLDTEANLAPRACNCAGARRCKQNCSAFGSASGFCAMACDGANGCSTTQTQC